jgi:hypothetical protein
VRPSIGVGPNNAAYIVGCGIAGPGGNGIFKLSGGLNGSWQQLSGAATQIYVTSSGTPWVVNALGTVYALTGGTFQGLGIPACATSLATTDKATWLVGCASVGAGGNGVYGYRASLITGTTNYQQAWDQVPGGAVKIAVQTDGTPWVVNALGDVYVLNHTL